MADTLYDRVVESVFFHHFSRGATEFVFERSELEEAARELGVRLPKNLGDVLYSYRFRRGLPASVTATATEGSEWVIELAGKARYRFLLARNRSIEPTEGQATVMVPDATPQIIRAHTTSDEQALLALVRYNRLVDIFLELAAYSLQNHLRTTVPGIGQIEIDELYVGIDGQGRQFIIPVQAKGGTDLLGTVQSKQDLAFCASKFPELLARPVAAQFLPDGSVVMFELRLDAGEVVVARERHYKLVGPHDSPRATDMVSAISFE